MEEFNPGCETCWEAENPDVGVCATVTCRTVAARRLSGTERVKLERGKKSAWRAAPTGEEPVYESAYWEEWAEHVPEISQSGERGRVMAPYQGAAEEEPRGESSKMAGAMASTGAAGSGDFQLKLTELPGRTLTDTGVRQQP